MQHFYTAFLAFSCAIGLGCSSSPTTGYSQIPTANDAGVVPADAAFDEGSATFAGTDGSDDNATPPPGTPVSSLTLEQVWAVTGAGGPTILIDFRSGAPVVTCGGPAGQLVGFEGSGVFTDPKTGQLLFYTDGQSVFNGKDNAVLDNGTGLLGNSSATEATLITPKNSGAAPTNTQFYVFSNNTNVDDASLRNPSSLWYSVIDLSVGLHGTVISKNQPLDTGNPGEALDVVPHANGQDFWVLAYEGAGSIKAFLVSAAGVSTTPVVSSTGLTGIVLRGAINHALDYDHLLLGAYGGSEGLIATAVIDRATGMVSNAKALVTGDLGYNPFFSKDGTKFYFVRGLQGYNGVASQYDLTLGNETVFGGSNMAAAKLAPDGKIYWAGYGNLYMGVVNQPDVAGTAANFVADGLDLKGCRVAFGVPNQTAAYLSYLPPAPK